MKKLILLLMVMALLISSATGCKRRPKGFPKCYPCSIVLLKDGEAIPGSRVTLVPAEKGKSYAASGTVDSTGLAVISTRQGDYNEEGAPEGEYKLVASAPPAIEVEEIDRATLRDMSMEERLALQNADKEAVRDADPIPESLRAPENSPVTITVKSSGENKIEVEMTDYEE